MEKSAKSNMNNGKRSVYTITHKTELPILVENNKNIKKLFDDYEEHCGLANDCNGMGYGEMFRMLKDALKGSHKDVYDNEKEAAKNSGLLETDPRSVYETVKALLL